MNKREAILAMLDGKKCCQPKSGDSHYWWDEKIGNFVSNGSIDSFFMFTTGTGWEIYEEFTYPMWFKSKFTGGVVKFTGLGTGEVVLKGTGNYEVGATSDCWVRHTRSDLWEQVEEPKPVRTVTIEKWIVQTAGGSVCFAIEGDPEYIKTMTSNMNRINKIKLLDSYTVELPND